MSPIMVAVLDYPGRRKEAPVSDLRLENLGIQVHYLLTDPTPLETSGSLYAQHLVKDLQSISSDSPAAILAYCFAAPIAQEMAAILTAAGRSAPSLVLFDAGLSSLAAARNSYSKAVAQLGGTQEMVVRLVGEIFSASAVNESMVSLMRKTLIDLAAAALIGLGCQDDEIPEASQELADQYMGWLVHLIAAASIAPRRWGGDVLHIMSKHHEFKHEWPEARSTQTLRVECERADLLRNELARRQVISWLTTRAVS